MDTQNSIKWSYCLYLYWALCKRIQGIVEFLLVDYSGFLLDSTGSLTQGKLIFPIRIIKPICNAFLYTTATMKTLYSMCLTKQMRVFCFLEKIQNGGTHTLNLVKYPDNLNQKGNTNCSTDVQIFPKSCFYIIKASLIKTKILHSTLSMFRKICMKFKRN